LSLVEPYLRVPFVAPGMRIGLLGGSFNPAHQGHRHISRIALARLGLDRVWWLVSPGNPLKETSKLPSLEARVSAARAAARHPRIAVTGFEGGLGLVYTIDTVRQLKQHYPQVHFVWLMGADNLAEFHRWRAWEAMFRIIPVAMFDRPGYGLKALASKAARRFAFARVDETDAGGLASLPPPAWAFLTLPLSGLSSTFLREAAGKGGGRKSTKPSKKKSK
jgi:nicotinate-nucleotide adenylyltransferase